MTATNQDPASVLLAGLVDDAGLFPPTQLPLAQAVERHRRDQQRNHPMHTHRFLCPSSRWDDLRGLLTERDRFDVGVILDDDQAGSLAAVPEPAAGDPLRVAHLEMRVEPADVGRAARYLRGTGSGHRHPVFLELHRTRGWQRSVAQLHGAHPLGLKIRCGGPRAELFPTPEELTEFIELAVANQVPMKATAGLHHAVRHTDPTTGFTHYGYLNLVGACAAAVAGAERDTVLAILTETDPPSLVARLHSTDPHTARRSRAILRSYGSCDTAQPIHEAAELALGPAR
ncbi:hypothetical protein RIF23_11755 [Lipingzhangella sp. LS1_29]|uniref:Uncharacterized protein n=1 Tax=Lipingzhangella rawalii TaxID=2055835 RepID=A0ABU2H6P4_9ACTN|nr:hypothetical protein [Lipingzhangella rawalii]MDS1270973.1 hypothetical protein [Lipingzhangella rawalii]